MKLSKLMQVKNTSIYANFFNFITYCRIFQEAENDIQLAISGKRGVGKSTYCILILAIYINRYGRICADCQTEFFYNNPKCPKCKSNRINKLYFDYTKHLRKYFIYDNAELQSKIKRAIPYTPFVCDEGVRFMLASDWNKPENRNLIKLLAVCRTKNLFIMYNMLRFNKIFSTYRQDIITQRVWLIKRGKAVLFEPDLSETQDCWYMQEFSNLTGIVRYLSSEDNLIKKVKRHKTFTDIMRFPDIDRKTYLYYKVLRDKVVYARDRPNISRHQKYFYTLLYNLENNWDKLLNEIVQSSKSRKPFSIYYNILFKDLKDKPVMAESTAKKHITLSKKIITIE